MLDVRVPIQTRRKLRWVRAMAMRPGADRITSSRSTNHLQLRGLGVSKARTGLEGAILAHRHRMESELGETPADLLFCESCAGRRRRPRGLAMESLSPSANKLRMRSDALPDFPPSGQRRFG